MIKVGTGTLTLEDFGKVLLGGEQIELEASVLKKVDASHQFLKNFSTQKLIYGINTGFGPMAQYKVSEDNVLQLQYNLIRSHSSGAGKMMPVLLGRAIMIARLNSLVQGYSGVHTELVELLRDMINKNVVPCIY